MPAGIAQHLLHEAYKKYENAQDEMSSHENIPISEREEIVVTEDEKETLTTMLSPTRKNQSQNHLECYNGAIYDNYSWSQTITDVDIQLKVPENITSKQLHVDILYYKICVKLKNQNTVYLQGDLCRKCKPFEIIWSLDSNILQIHLEKASESWWDCLVLSEPKLDFSKMDCSRPFYELSDEAQAKIEELTWNQERKMQGLPTTDQIELEKTLKRAWNDEESPFPGEFDPSQVNLS